MKLAIHSSLDGVSVYSLCNKQEHNSIESIASRILEDETSRNTNRINTRKTIPNLHPKHAQTDKEQDHKCKEQQDMIKRLERNTNITHTPREESTFFVRFDERRFDFRPGDIAVIVLVKDAECFAGFFLVIESRVKIGRDEECAFAVFETVVDCFSQSLQFRIDISMILNAKTRVKRTLASCAELTFHIKAFNPESLPFRFLASCNTAALTTFAALTSVPSASSNDPRLLLAGLGVGGYRCGESPLRVGFKPEGVGALEDNSDGGDLAVLLPWPLLLPPRVVEVSTRAGGFRLALFAFPFVLLVPLSSPPSSTSPSSPSESRCSCFFSAPLKKWKCAFSSKGVFLPSSVVPPKPSAERTGVRVPPDDLPLRWPKGW